MVMRFNFVKIFSGKFLSVFGLGLIFLLSSCREDDPAPASQIEITNEANQYVNSWISEKMEYWYLWNHKLPASPDKNAEPKLYFKSLLASEDRFSWIQTNYQELLNSLQGINKEAGYEYVLYRDKEKADNVLLQILYIKPGSPVASSELKRGDVITHINGQLITVNNYKTLLESLKNDHTVQYKPLLADAQKFGESKSISLTAVQYSENPNYLNKTIETGGRKIGYFVYNFFASGTDQNPQKYDVEMDAIFSKFKTDGITDLILDLRYNSGGSESSAKNLASYIGKGVDQNKIFLRREYNPKVEAVILKDASLGKNFLISNYLVKSNNIGTQLSSGRIYVLTSSRTASASELIINALKPFMEVFLIGETTYGKNVGSISLYEKNDPKNTWGMQPIVVKVYNSLNQSDYGTGFVPDVIHPDNGLFLYPLGDPREALLSKAIGQITGTATMGRSDDSADRRRPLAHSLDFKRRGFDLVIDENIPSFLLQ